MFSFLEKFTTVINDNDENEAETTDDIQVDLSDKHVLNESEIRFAGLSLPKNIEACSGLIGANAPVGTWNSCLAETFSLRVGPNYNLNKQKAPSECALMELVGVDMVACDKKIDNICTRVTFPKEWTDIETNNPSVPPLFVINFQIPSESGVVFSMFQDIKDGPGYSVVLYFCMTPETISHMANLEFAPPAVRLLVRYLSEGPESDHDPNGEWRGRFKTMVMCSNIEDFGLPSFITSYNAKPVLIRQTGTLIRGPKYVEMDINVHRFGSVPRRALQIMKDRFDRMNISIGFCIESREEDEMPERLFGCASLNKPIYMNAPKW